MGVCAYFHLHVFFHLFLLVSQLSKSINDQPFNIQAIESTDVNGGDAFIVTLVTFINDLFLFNFRCFKAGVSKPGPWEVQQARFSDLPGRLRFHPGSHIS